MPCTSSEPTRAEAKSRLVAQLAIHVVIRTGGTAADNLISVAASPYGDPKQLDSITAFLCKRLGALTDEQIDKVVYDGRSPMARKLADWWEDHKKADAARAGRENAASESVRKFLDLSTAHLDEESLEFLELASDPNQCTGTVCGRTQYGFFAYAQENPNDYGSGVPPVLADIFELARERGCEYVLVDRDSPALAALPVFDDEPDGISQVDAANAMTS